MRSVVQYNIWNFRCVSKHVCELGAKRFYQFTCNVASLFRKKIDESPSIVRKISNTEFFFTFPKLLCNYPIQFLLLANKNDLDSAKANTSSPTFRNDGCQICMHTHTDTQLSCMPCLTRYVAFMRSICAIFNSNQCVSNIYHISLRFIAPPSLSLCVSVFLLLIFVLPQFSLHACVMCMYLYVYVL